MKRGVIVSLTVAVAAAGFALGQNDRANNVFVTQDPAPPPSVIRLDPNMPRTVLPAPQPRPPVSLPQRIQPAGYLQNAPVVESFRQEPAPTVKPITPDSSPELLPPPSPISAIVDDHQPAAPSYTTNVFAPIFPWTKCGKRVCGTVYIDTPYYWVDARYLFGWFKKDRSPPLATTAPPGVPGTLDDPRTTVLFDGESLHDQPYMGGYFTAGGWFDECQYCGGEVGYFFFASQDKGYITTANGFPGTNGLYVPFFNPLTGAEDVFLVSETGNVQSPVFGSIRINSRSRAHGADGHFLFSFTRGMSYRCDALAGVRWLGLDEDLIIEENIRLSATPNRLPTEIGIFDRFGTRTDFIGADLGFKSHFERGCWSCDVLTRVALGGNHQIIRGDGFTGTTLPFAPAQVLPGGIVQNGRLIGPANNGVFGNDVFSIVPEVGISVSYRAAHWCRLTLGYNYMYWTNVVRPGSQVDRVVNPIGVSTRREFNMDIYEPRRPGVAFNETDLWLQSATLGIQFLF